MIRLWKRWLRALNSATKLKRPFSMHKSLLPSLRPEHRAEELLGSNTVLWHLLPAAARSACRHWPESGTSPRSLMFNVNLLVWRHFSLPFHPMSSFHFTKKVWQLLSVIGKCFFHFVLIPHPTLPVASPEVMPAPCRPQGFDLASSLPQQCEHIVLKIDFTREPSIDR